jgi:hypothetical protein
LNENIRVVRVENVLWDKLKKRADTMKWPFPTFSCNKDYEVWPGTTKGLTPVKDRRFLNFKKFPFLEEIVDSVLSIEPDGGRFHINSDNSVILTKSNEVACKLVFY